MARSLRDPKETGGIYNPAGNAKFGDMAYFAGTGPAGKTCASCFFFNTGMFKNKTSVRGKCMKAQAMRGVGHEELSAVYGPTASCKYYERRDRDATTD